MNGFDSVRRRRLLELSGVAVGVALAGCSDNGDGGDGDGGLGDDDGNSTDGTETGGGTQQIRLGAETMGWIGQEPPEIADETNPTLSFEPGTTYEITWENLDGEEHELLVLDGDQKTLEASDSAKETGATVTLKFEASEEMAEYICEYHPDQMRGEIDVGGSTGNETTGNETDTDGNETGGGGGGNYDIESTG